MFEKVNKKDEEIDAQIQTIIDKANRRSVFKRVFSYNSPMWVFWGGMICTLVIGSTQPLFGIFFSKILAVLTDPRNRLDTDKMNEETNKWIYCILACGGAHLTIGFLSKYSFGYLAENVTLKIRRQLYANILRKNIGWFDK